MVTDTDSYAFFITDLTPTRGRPRLNHIMNRLMMYGVSAVALICMLMTSACSDDSIGTIDYSKVTTGRMDLSNSIAIGLKSTDDGDKNLKPGLYKIDDNGNITTAELLVTVNDDDKNHQEPLRVVPHAISTASDSYLVAAHCQYFDKNDKIANVPYTGLLVRKSDGKIWGINDNTEWMFDWGQTGGSIDNSFKLKGETLFFCSGDYYNNIRGDVYKVNLTDNIISVQQITENRNTFPYTYHIDDDGVMFSYGNVVYDDSHFSRLNLYWPHAGEKEMMNGFYQKNDESGIENINLPLDVIIDLIPENIMEEYQFTGFKITPYGDLEFSAMNNHPVAFLKFTGGMVSGVYAESEIDLWCFDFMKDNYEAIYDRINSYVLSHGLIPTGYFDIDYETPLYAKFGNFHEIHAGDMDGLPGTCIAFEGDSYSIVVYDGHYVSKIDHNRGTSEFLKKTETEFRHAERKDNEYSPYYNPCFLYSDKLWTYHNRDKFVRWFDLNSLEEGRVDFNKNVPEYMQKETWIFENGNLIFGGFNPVNNNPENFYVNILTGNTRKQETVSGINFKTLINLK